MPSSDTFVINCDLMLLVKVYLVQSAYQCRSDLIAPYISLLPRFERAGCLVMPAAARRCRSAHVFHHEENPSHCRADNFLDDSFQLFFYSPCTRIWCSVSSCPSWTDSHVLRFQVMQCWELYSPRCCMNSSLPTSTRPCIQFTQAPASNTIIIQLGLPHPPHFITVVVSFHCTAIR